MVKEYEDIIQPPEQFRDGYKPIPKPRTDRPLQMQKARRPPKPQGPPPPSPKRKPSSKIKELSRGSTLFRLGLLEPYRLFLLLCFSFICGPITNERGMMVLWDKISQNR